jgi:hypothetical protein
MGPRNSTGSDELDQSERSSEVRELRRMLGSLPARQPSVELTTRLRVLASKESARRQSRASVRQLLRTWTEDFRLFANNLMRPLAIPTAGGFVSALLLFGVLAPSLATRGDAAGVDVPTALYTEASVRSFIPLGFQNEDLTVEVTIDGDGRVIDYTFSPAHENHALHRSIENYLLFTQFTPVRSFGQPVKAKVRISFQSSRIEVRG